MSARNKFFAFSVAALAGLSLSAAAFAAPSGREITLNGLTYAGSGCPIGSATATIAPAGDAFTVLFDEYAAEAGPGIPLSEGRKFCQVTLDLRIPHGWQYSIFKVDYRGFASLDAGAQGMLSSSYYFTGAASSSDPTLRTLVSGPYSRDYQVKDQIGVESVVWSRCGVDRPLNIKTSVQVRARNGSRAYMTVDSIDGEFKQIYYFQWRSC